jgi:uncharacterized membrane protein
MTAPASAPGLKPLAMSDLVDSLAAGLADLRAAPRFGLTIGLIFALAGWILIALLWRLGLPYLAYPLAMGFVIVAPFAAVGLYAVSDHLERGKPPSWASVLGAIRESTRRDLRWMAFVSGFALVIWMDIAAFTFFAFMGFEAFDATLIDRLLTTPTGLLFLILGHLIGAAIAAIVFSISAVSFPLLYDRDLDFVTAMLTSVRTVQTNPAVMLTWAIVIAVLIGLSLASGFLGLIVALPLIGHATWHIYRRAVDADALVASARRHATSAEK